MTRIRMIIGMAFLCLLGVMNLVGQENSNKYKLYLKNDTRLIKPNISEVRSIANIEQYEIYESRFYRYLQFDEIPTQDLIAQCHEKGILFLEYVPNNTYVVSIPCDIDFTFLDIFAARALIEIPYFDKMDVRLSERPFPEWTMEEEKVRVIIKMYDDVPVKNVIGKLERFGVEQQDDIVRSDYVIGTVEPNSFEELARLPFVQYLDFESQPGLPESDIGRRMHRSNAINVDYQGGYNFDGAGVHVAVNDDGYVGPHIDFSGRTNQSDVLGDFSGVHGDMTAGIVGAAGNLDPTKRGMAPGAFLWIRQYDATLPNTLNLHQNEGVVVFSTSYSNGCNAGYTISAQMVDEEIADNPTLMQVFSAGNANHNNCGYGAGDQWGNITGGHKMAKNAITAANLTAENDLANSSSRGPASDGRLKPDVSAHGQGQWSTAPNNSYDVGGGTSAAAPGVAGVLAQLHQAYREGHNGVTAPSALLKAVLLNTADDLGNAGPDFKFGWGKVNAFRALKALGEGRYFYGATTQGVTTNYQLSVPAGVQEMRVMVCWNDAKGSTVAQTSLVNNIDLQVITPTNTSRLPLVLDHSPNDSTLNLPAQEGVDSINNVEQVRLLAPDQGIYTVSVVGSTIPMGPQEYYIAYEFYYNDIRVVYPIGGEGLCPGAMERIHWDANGDSGSFLAECSFDGQTWVNLASNVPGDMRFVDFQLPDTVATCKVRISRGGISGTSDQFFSLIGVPDNLRINAFCPDSSLVHLVWDSVPGATAYDVFYLGTQYMDSVTTTNFTNCYFPYSPTVHEHWASVRARGPSGVVGKRAIAVNAIADDCYLNCISEDDVGVVSIQSPSKLLGGCSQGAHLVKIEITSLGTAPQSDIPLCYQYDNEPIVVDTFAGVLQGGGIEPFTFSQPLTITEIGPHSLKVWCALSNDGAPCNDTLNRDLIYHEPIIAFPYVEGFEHPSFPPPSMEIENVDGAITWDDALVIGIDGKVTRSAYMDNRSYAGIGQEDLLSILAFDLSNTDYAHLKFDVAYSSYMSTYTDGLRIDVSTDCGATFTTVYFKEGDSLATVTGSQASWWEPAFSSDWRTDSVDLSAFTGGLLKIRVVSIAGYGNGLYVDNIEVSNVVEDAYCVPSSNCSPGDCIDDFSFHTISHTETGCSGTGYSNFLSYSTFVDLGGLYQMTVSTKYEDQFVSLWIDFNNDTVFDNVSERLVYDFSVSEIDSTYTTWVVIPIDVPLGVHRMRVSTSWGVSNSDPCGVMFFGEIHDYSVVITSPPPPELETSADTSICEGGWSLLSVAATGGIPPYDFIWDNGFTESQVIVSPNTPTSYTVTVTDAIQNSSVANVEVLVFPKPNTNLGGSVVLMEGDSVMLDAGAGFAGYEWSTGATTSTITIDTIGLFSVTVHNSFGCSNSDQLDVAWLLPDRPSWGVNPSGSSHTIMLTNNISVMVAGNPIDSGDYIGVFYDSLGVLKCGGYLMWENETVNLNAYGAINGADGFAANETFNWKIWTHSTNQEYDADAIYMPSPPMPNGGLYQNGGLSALSALTARIEGCQILELKQGWSIISSYIYPDSVFLPHMFAPVVDNLVIMKNGYGDVYVPQWTLNNIVDFDPLEGYHINMDSTRELEVSGMLIDPVNTTIGLPSGWSLMPYFYASVQSIEVLLSAICQDIDIVKNGDGNVYWPSWGVNTIVNMIPGEGYHIKLNNSHQFNYPLIIGE